MAKKKATVQVDLDDEAPSAPRTIRRAAESMGVPLSWSAAVSAAVKLGVPAVIALGVVYWMATQLSTKQDAHISETKEMIQVQKQQLDVMWQFASSSQRGCINLAKLAKTDPIECTTMIQRPVK